MDNQVFDKFAKQKLESAQTVVDSQLWHDIRKRMPVAPWILFLNKYGLPIYGTFASLGLLASAWFWYYNQETLASLASENMKLKQQLAQTIVLKPSTIHHNRIDTIYIIKKVILEKFSAPHFVFNPVPISSFKASNGYVAPLSFSVPILATNDTIQNRSGNIVVSNDNYLEQKNTLDSSKQNTPNSIKPTEPITTKKIKLPTPHIRIGLDSKFTNKIFGLGGSFELFLSNRLSFFTGINVHKHPKMEYKDLKQYNLLTGQDFISQFGKYIPVNDFISDITIKNTVLEAPIGMRYYVPLKPNLNIVFGAYSNLDLKVYERIKVESYLKAEEKYTSFEEILSPQTLYDAVFSIGLQKKWSKMFFEISPYTTIRLREPNYNADTNEKIGIKTSIYFDAKKP